MAAVIHVSPNGSDINAGTATHPFRTIGAAAAMAQPGDTVQVGAGTYRERIDPPRGGTSSERPIVYEAAAGDHVVLTGSDVFSDWSQITNGLWQLVIPSRYFGDFNPYAERVHGDWFDNHGRTHRRGNVFLDGAWLPESHSVESLSTGIGLGWVSTVDGLHDLPTAEVLGVEGHAAFDPAVFDAEGNTVIFARFPGDVDPNGGRVEVCVRATVFTPTAEHIDYITVRGFEIRNAATNWVSPTAGQEGMVTPYWSRGWVIEDNEICYSRCGGIALAKNRDEFDGERGTTDGYYFTIADAAARDGWSQATIGSHTVRNNHIHHCGQVGIVGSLGCSFSTIENNDIHDCNTQGIWGGAEMAGIKLHAAIDVVIKGNHIHRCGEPGGIWLDWMAQGAQIVGNFMHDNTRDIFTEVNHGPILIANNILLSRKALLSNSRGMSIVHNLIAGTLEVLHDNRETPYLKPHSTEVVAMRRLCSVGDIHCINNILGQAVDLTELDKALPEQPCTRLHNVGLDPENDSRFAEAPEPWLEQADGAWHLAIASPSAWTGSGERITSDTLGQAVVPAQGYTNPDGSRLEIDHDYYGNLRGQRVTPGPFEPLLAGTAQVWPRAAQQGSHSPLARVDGTAETVMAGLGSSGPS